MSMISFSRSLWALACIGLLAVPSPGVAQEASIEVTVTVGSVPVDDADVTIPALGRRARVDKKGRATFTGVPGGTFVVEAVSQRWGRGLATVRVASGEVARASVALEPIFHLDEMVVSAGVGATRRSEAYQPATVVTGRDLVALGEATLGETLSRTPGVTSTYFGPGSSRPVIRGMGGDRIRILEAGIGSGDASSTSPDHAVSVEPRGAERIEVIRGAATLLYGSSAVGGVVNVFDGTIAREPPTQLVSGYLDVLGGTVADERTGSFSVAARKGPLVLKANGLWRNTSDYAIPGSAAEEGGGEKPVGVLEDSELEGKNGALGLTLVGDRGYLGAAYKKQRLKYGVPGGAREGGEGGVAIDLDQDRFALEGLLRFRSHAARNLKGSFGAASYTHVELEGGEVGTTFKNDYWEGRLESEHQFGEGVHGAVGAQVSSRNFETIGEEAFVPPSETRMLALFAYEEVSAGDALRVQGGLRTERQTAEAPTRGITRVDWGVSTSLGLYGSVSEKFSLALTASRSVKLPNAEELFSNGPHVATRAFEIGDPRLGTETAVGLDATAHIHFPAFRASASAFTTGFSGYIYEAATGEVRDGLRAFGFTQGDARFTGFELEAELDVIEGATWESRPHLSVEAMADYVRAELTTTGTPLPRVSPMRIGGGLNYRHGPFTMRGFVRRTLRQSRVAPLEEPTAGFTMVDATFTYRVFTGRIFHDITLVGSNLTNQEARLHTSFLKKFAPLPGRELRLVYRLNF